MVNKVILLGRLGADPELRYTPNQVAVCNLRLATNERRKTAEGEWQETTEWHSVVAFGKTAENCANYLQKGRQVFVEGRIQTRKWQDQEGKDRYRTEVIAATVQFIGGRESGVQGGVQVERQGGRAAAGAPMPSGDDIPLPPIGETVSFDDDDIPF